MTLRHIKKKVNNESVDTRVKGFVGSHMSSFLLEKGFKPRRVLFIELSEMGSAILAYSVMKKAKGLFNAELYFMIFKENKESGKLLDIIPKKNIITIRSKSFFLLFIDTVAAIFRVRSRKIDTVIDVEL